MHVLASSHEYARIVFDFVLFMFLVKVNPICIPVFLIGWIGFQNKINLSQNPSGEI